VSDTAKIGDAGAVMDSLPRAKSFIELEEFMAKVAGQFPEQIPIPTMRALIVARFGTGKNTLPHVVRILRDLGWITKLNAHTFRVRYGHD